MHSLPNDWAFSVASFTQFCKEGPSAISSGLQELEEMGFVTRTRKRNNGKYAKMDYSFYEDPSLNSNWHSPASPTPEKPVSEKPKQAKPVLEKPQYII